MTRLATHQYAVNFEGYPGRGRPGEQIDSGWYSSQDDENLLALTRKLRAEKRAYKIIERRTEVRTQEIISWDPPAPPPYQFLLNAPITKTYLSDRDNARYIKVSDTHLVGSLLSGRGEPWFIAIRSMPQLLIESLRDEE